MKRYLLILILCIVSIVAAEEQDVTLTLEEAFRISLSNNEEIQILELEEKQVALLPWRALTVMFPSLKFEGSILYPEEEIGFGSETALPDEQREASLVLTQPIFQGSMFKGYQAAEHRVSASQMEKEYQVRSFLFRVADAFFSVLKGQQLLSVEKERLKLAGKQHQISMDRFNAGEVPRTDFLQTEVEVTRAKRGLERSRNRLLLAEKRLKRLLSSKLESYKLQSPEENPDFDLSSEASLAAYVETAYQQRSDLSAAKVSLKAAKAELAMFKRKFLPSLDLELKHSWIDPENFMARDDFSTATINFTVPFLDGGRKFVDVKEASYKLRAAEKRLSLLKKDIQLQIAEAFLEAKTKRFSLNTLEKELEFSKENYQTISKRYRLGQATSLDVNDSFTKLIVARVEQVNHVHDYQLALLNLMKEMGILGAEHVN